MKRYVLIVLGIALFALSCERREHSFMFGIDRDSYISADIYGSYRNYNGMRFTSSSGTYTSDDHPELTIHSDGTFSFKLDRGLYAQNGDYMHLCFYWDKEDSEFEFGKVYSLTLFGLARADVDLYEQSEHFMYKAVNGWIIFRSRRPYDGGLLYSGEFRFEGCTEDGDRIVVENGKFIDCRICWGDDYGCAAY